MKLYIYCVYITMKDRKVQRSVKLRRNQPLRGKIKELKFEVIMKFIDLAGLKGCEEKIMVSLELSL